MGVPCGEAGSMTMSLWTPPRSSATDGAPSAAVLLIQEIFGVGPYIRVVAERLAGLGYLVGAPDVFWRFAPNWQSSHDADGMAASIEQVGNLDVPAAIADCVAALGVLGSLPGITNAPGVIGFCLGGTLAWGVAAAAEPGVCVSYYGSGVPSMLGMIDDIHCPTLLHFGSDDAFIPSEGVEAIGSAIAGRTQFVLNVENAGHAFDNHEAEMFWNEGAANAAWAKTSAFLGAHLPA